jgi:hypothetical protein
MSAAKKPVVVTTDLGLTWIGISVGVNGYTVTIEGDPPDDIYVFRSYNELQKWLFDNLEKPAEAETN